MVDDPKILLSKKVEGSKGNPKAMIQIVVLAVLGLVLAVLLFNTFLGGKKKAPPPAVPAAAVPAPAAAAPPAAPQAVSAPAAAQDTAKTVPAVPGVPASGNEWGADAFLFGEEDEEDAGADDTGRLELQGIVFSSENPYAIIDGKIVKKGDAIADNKIVEISQDAVVLEDGQGERQTLKS
ncbi:MAG: hypothetical protein ACOY3K_06155 [Candidatus Omnitrophota bacterium]